MPRRNLDPNPAAAVDLTGITAFTSTAFTPTRVTTGLGAWLRTTGVRATTPATAGSYTEIRRAPHNPGTNLDGLPCSGAIQWSASAALACSVFLVALDNAGTGLLGFQNIDLTPAAGALVTTTITYPALPAGTRRVAMWVRANSAPTGHQLTTGLCRLDLVVDPNLAPRDGADTALGWSWDGTAGSSTSTQLVDPAAAWWCGP